MDEAALPLSDAARAGLARFAWASEVASTQDWAMAGPVPGRGAAVYVAASQSAGRGRRGRGWQTPPDAALAMTVLRAFDVPLWRLAPVGLVLGVAVAGTLHRSGLGALRLKWPNDLVVDGRKLGGLLVEVRSPSEDGRPALAMGLGINRALPADIAIDQPWTDLAREGLAIDAAALVGRVLDAVLPALDRFEREGFAPFATQWPHFDALAGRRVRVEADGRGREGIALGIDADGGLRVRHAEGEHVHLAGEVSVRVAA